MRVVSARFAAQSKVRMTNAGIFRAAVATTVRFTRMDDDSGAGTNDEK